MRQVFDEQDTQQQQQQQHQQSSPPPSQSSRSQRATNSVPPSTASATTYRVNRVSTYNDTSELVFDLRGDDADFSDIRICAVKTADASSRCVETFCIAGDSDFDDVMTSDSQPSLEDISYLYVVIRIGFHCATPPMVFILRGLTLMMLYHGHLFAFEMIDRGDLSRLLDVVQSLLHFIFPRSRSCNMFQNSHFVFAQCPWVIRMSKS